MSSTDPFAAAADRKCGPYVTGLFAAAVTPVDDGGNPDLATFDRVLGFLVAAGVDGVCLGGATAEYPHFETDDRKVLIRAAARRLPRDQKLLVGIGGPTLQRTVDLGRSAMDAGAHALLLPMPLFFRYDQPDLREYCATVARALEAPCLLYDLPDFTNPIETATAFELLRTGRGIVGIKDSSGRLERIDAFVQARGAASWSLVVGDDRLLGRGVAAGWNGGISGVAAFCPELLVSLYRASTAGDADGVRRDEAALSELIDQISVFPTPWGIRIGLHARGIETGPLPLPMTAERRRQAARFQEWLPGWLERSGLATVSAPA